MAEMLLQAQLGLDHGEDITWILSNMLNTLSMFAYEEHVLHWRPQCARFILGIIASPELARYHTICWYIIHTSLELATRQNSVDASFEDLDTISFAVFELNIVSVIAHALPEMDREETLQACVVCLTPICLHPSLVGEVLRCDIPRILLPHIRARMPSPTAAGMLVVLTNLAIHPEAHQALRLANCIEFAQQQLPNLTSQNLQVLDCALTSAFLLCRLGEELGEESSVLVRKMRWILHQVCEAGPGGIVLGSRWNPANIVMDFNFLAQTATSELTSIIPTLCDAVQVFGAGNARLVKFASQLLWEFTLIARYGGSNGDEKALLVQHKYKVKRVLVHAQTACVTTDLHTMQLIKALLQEFDALDTGSSIAFSALGLVWDRVDGIKRWFGWKFNALFRPAHQAQQQHNGDGGINEEELLHQ